MDQMQVFRISFRVGIAVLGAGVLSTVLFLLLGVVLPVWSMMAIHGRQPVQDAPAHGGVVLFATLPIAGVVSLAAFTVLAVGFFQKLQPAPRQPEQ